MKIKEDLYINRELSWLAFNERVLQEAGDQSVPLLMRLKFLGIFSSNLDEFFRVRVATLKRISKVKGARSTLGFSPKKILEEIQNIAVEQQAKFERIFQSLLTELAKYQIYVINENQLTDEQGLKVKNFFHRKVRPLLVPLMIDSMKFRPNLNDGSIYLAIYMIKGGGTKKRYSLIEVPRNIDRFFIMDEHDGKYIILIDDVIRYCLNDIFSMFSYERLSAYTIKITKDSELEIDLDISKSFVDLMSDSIKQRKTASAVRFIYDKEMPNDLLTFLQKKLKIGKRDNIISGGRYHNFKDFMGFPKLGPKKLSIQKFPPLEHPDINPYRSFFKRLKKKDVMLHYPYHSFLPMLDFLREAAIDHRVEYIYITLYRAGSQSQIVNALINAHMNGKKVLVVIELLARFDEEANIYWTRILSEAGIKVLHGPKDMKVHSKICLVGRREASKIVRYANFSTGNYNEDTAKLYADDSLFTSHPGITLEAEQVFSIIEKKDPLNFRFQHLWVAPYYMFDHISKRLDIEIKNAQEGKEAYIIAKLNNLNDEGIIKKLYKASKAGVKVFLIIRTICSLRAGVKGLSENIIAISIVDKYLEHSRIVIFANNGDEKYYLSSADWMERNIHRRIEVACPIYDEGIQRDLKKMLTLQLRDNVKARYQGADVQNKYKRIGDEKIRSQNEIYNYFAKKLKS